jgi:hypothetical protein
MQNKYNLSKYNEAFLEYDDYDKNEDYISATTLLKPTREILINRKWNGLEYYDVSDRIAIKIGTGLHNLRENTPYDDAIMREERMFCSLNHLGVSKFGLSGKPDLIDYDYNQPQIESDKGLIVIEDLKVSSIYKLKFGDFNDYVLQLSILKYLALRDENFKKKLKGKGIEQNEESFSEFGIITFLAKDWSNRDRTISPIAIKEIPLKLLKDKEIELRIERKCIELQRYWDIESQEDFPICSEKIKKKFNGKMCEKYCSARFKCTFSPVFKP